MVLGSHSTVDLTGPSVDSHNVTSPARSVVGRPSSSARQPSSSARQGEPGTTDTEQSQASTSPSSSSSSALKTPSFTTLTENRSLVTRAEWDRAVQDEVTSHASLSLSKRKKYPNLWRVVTKYAEKWRDSGWHYASAVTKDGTSNITNFKYKMINHIVNTRGKPQSTKDHTELVQSILSSSKNDTTTNELKEELDRFGVYIYPQDLFLDYCIRNFRLDVVGSMKQRDFHSENDIIRLFSVMALNEHRQDVLSLARHNVVNRAEMDQAYGREDMIFLRISKSFNNKNIKVQLPSLFHTLDSKDQLNPNDSDVCEKNRSPKWLRSLHKQIMSEYRFAMRKRTSGTGGGSGAPKDYSNWNTRDMNKFVNYGGGKGKTVVKKDYLAYILMTDKDVGWVFSSSFSPAPRHTVFEDGFDGGDSRNGRSVRRKTGDSLADLGHSICDTVDDTMKRVTSGLLRVAGVELAADNEHLVPRHMTGEASTSNHSDNVNEMNKIMDFMARLDEEKAHLESLGDSVLTSTRLKFVHKALLKASKMLNEHVSSDGEQDETDGEQEESASGDGDELSIE